MKTVALDFDGVVADTLSPRATLAAELFGINVMPHLCSKSAFTKLYGVERYQELLRRTGYADTLDARPMRGAINGIHRLSAWSKLIMVTNRGPEKLYWAERWLAENGVRQFFSEIASSNGTTKGLTAIEHKATVLIDNDWRHLIHPTAAALCCLLLFPDIVDDPQLSNIRRCVSWSELVVAVNECPEPKEK